MSNTELTGMEIAGAAAAQNQLTRIAERVAGLEARTATETATLKEDTKAIRGMFHDLNNKLQVFIGSEERSAAALRALDARFADHSAEIARLVAIVERLVMAKTKAEGAWWLIGKMTLVLGFVGSGIAAAATTMWWALTHLAIKP
jgi:hypothetical protein